MSAQQTQAIVAALLAVSGSIFILKLAKKQFLTFRYTAGWLVLLGVIAFSGVLLPVSSSLAKVLSTSPGVLVSSVAIFVLVLICIQLSISISGLQRQVQTLAEIVALQGLSPNERPEATSEDAPLS